MIAAWVRSETFSLEKIAPDVVTHRSLREVQAGGDFEVAHAARQQI